MYAFSRLFARLDATSRTTEKIVALRGYFGAESAANAAWAIYFLSGQKPRQVVPTRKLGVWAAEAAGIPLWLFEECYDAVGDLAEAIALILPAPERSSELPLHAWVEERLLPLRGLPEVAQKECLRQYWDELDQTQRLVWNKLITGSFRVGVSQQLVTRALAENSGLPVAVVSHRLMGDWEPTPQFFDSLIDRETSASAVSRPYPFFLAHPLEAGPESLGEIGDWQVEWKWDGIRAQLLRRQGASYLWSRGEELVTDRYPELQAGAARLPDGTAIDGELVAWKNGTALPFGELQRRIGRKSLGKKILADVPVVFMAFDLLEDGGRDIRAEPLRLRRQRLEERQTHLPAESNFALSPLVVASSWEELAAQRAGSRERQVEGLMLKHHDSAYAVGRPRGSWWKWKINPYTVDAVLIYAQRGHGRRASLYTDYTFGVWDQGALVPFAKAYSGLTDEEIHQVDAFVRRHTVERFGPVRSVTPELVFELAFESIQPSTRHKSGIAVRFPRMSRWRKDKAISEADSLDTIRALIAAPGRYRATNHPGK